MEESIQVSLDRIRSIIATFGSAPFTTADVIRQYSGSFCSNTGTPAYYSFNAQFGKLLKRNENELSIMEIQKDFGIKDDHGHSTSTSIWQIGS